MNYERIPYITADNDVIINEKSIKWIKKINDCMEICTNSTGCSMNNDTHKICKINNLESFLRLDKKFSSK